MFIFDFFYHVSDFLVVSRFILDEAIFIDLILGYVPLEQWIWSDRRYFHRLRVWAIGWGPRGCLGNLGCRPRILQTRSDSNISYDWKEGAQFIELGGLVFEVEAHEFYEDDVHACAKALYAHRARDQVGKHVVNQFDLIHDQVFKLSVFCGK